MSTRAAAPRPPSNMTMGGIEDSRGTVASAALLLATSVALPSPELWSGPSSRPLLLLLLLLLSLLRRCSNAASCCPEADGCLASGARQQRESRSGSAVRQPIARLAARHSSGK